MRIHLFEFEDLHWFPGMIRKGMTDYLRYILGNLLNFYEPVTPLIYEGMKHSRSTTIIDLASGGGGGIQQIQHNLKELSGETISIILTDKFPNTESYQYIKQQTAGTIDYVETPVDVTSFPKGLHGFRVMFSAFHHFKPAEARSILQNAVDHNAGIAIFDGGDKNFFTILAIIFFHPFAFCIHTPFFRPFRFSRLFFTYLVPLIPLCTIWDGVVSILRLYKPEDMLKITGELNAHHYTWKAGKIKHQTGLHIAYLVGYPQTTVKPEEKSI